MTASRSTVGALAAPIADYEPPPIANGDARARRSGRLRAVSEPVAEAVPRPLDLPPPAAARAFAAAALRRVLEVSDRRRPLAQLRPLVTPALFDAVSAWPSRPRTSSAAVLRRVRLRTASGHDGVATALEVFATFSRGPRLHAAAGRIEISGGRWQFVALQLG